MTEAKVHATTPAAPQQVDPDTVQLDYAGRGWDASVRAADLARRYPAHRDAARLYGDEFHRNAQAIYRALRARHGPVAPVLLDDDVLAWLVIGYRSCTTWRASLTCSARTRGPGTPGTWRHPAGRCARPSPGLTRCSRRMEPSTRGIPRRWTTRWAPSTCSSWRGVASGSPGSQTHLAFGSGPHRCPYPSQDVAETVARTAVTVLLDRLPDLTHTVPAGALVWQPTVVIRSLLALPIVFTSV